MSDSCHQSQHPASKPSLHREFWRHSQKRPAREPVSFLSDRAATLHAGSFESVNLTPLFTQVLTIASVTGHAMVFKDEAFLTS